MNKTEILEKLEDFRNRLKTDVISGYNEKGLSYGHERFKKWRTLFTKFLDEELPGTSKKLDENLSLGMAIISPKQSNVDRFMNNYGESCFAFIDSLIIDIKNDEFDFSPPLESMQSQEEKNPSLSNERVFIVHGHDGQTKTETARFIEKLGFKAVILHEQANEGMTIIEKIEKHTDVNFAIVLYTDDDYGNAQADAKEGNLKSRARQNVVFEHGYLTAKLTRKNVVALVSKDDIELPSDISGIVYINKNANWEIEIAKEMKAAGYPVDLNLLSS